MNVYSFTRIVDDVDMFKSSLFLAPGIFDSRATEQLIAIDGHVTKDRTETSRGVCVSDLNERFGVSREQVSRLNNGTAGKGAGAACSGHPGKSRYDKCESAAAANSPG